MNTQLIHHTKVKDIYFMSTYITGILCAVILSKLTVMYTFKVVKVRLPMHELSGINICLSFCVGLVVVLMK